MKNNLDKKKVIIIRIPLTINNFDFFISHLSKNHLMFTYGVENSINKRIVENVVNLPVILIKKNVYSKCSKTKNRNNMMDQNR